MRKLKLQMQTSVDGFVAGPNGEMDWMALNWDDELKQLVTEITEPVDLILLGRKMADGFISHWANVAADSNNPDFTAGKKFTDTHKVVFTKTLESSQWKNTTLAKGDLAEEVSQLKNRQGGDIIVYGGASFVSSLIKENLIDEYNFFVNPTAIGKGMDIFNGLEDELNLKPVKSKLFSCGVIHLCYEPKRD